MLLCKVISEQFYATSKQIHYLMSSLSLSHYIQYPLRPGHMPYDGDSVLEARTRGEQLEMTFGLETRGQHFSQSKGMHYSSGLMTDQGGPGGGNYFRRLPFRLMHFFILFSSPSFFSTLCPPSLLQWVNGQDSVIVSISKIWRHLSLCCWSL